jgi:signal transduction histidine kinase
MKHKLLIRQVKKYLGRLENMPPEWEKFLNAVDIAYQQSDEDYALLEHAMDMSAEEILEKSNEIEWFYRLPDENPHPVLRISRDGQLLYFNQASLPLLRLSNSDPTQPLSPEWKKLARNGFGQGANKTVELQFSERVFSITFSPVVEQDYVNIYGFDISDRKLAENYLLDHNKILGDLVAGKLLQEILDRLCRKAEKYSMGLMSSILILDRSKTFLYYGSAPSLPAGYVKKTRKIFPGPKEGSCGTAAFQKRTIAVEDISSDPLWEKYKETALAFGLRACWSTPILDFKGEVLGTFACYYTQPRPPSPEEIELIRTSANFAALAIQNYNAKNDLKSYAEELERSNNDLKDFAHIASHDLQEPLRKISVFSDRLRDTGSQLSEKHRDYLSRIGNAAQRMRALIDDLLKLSQVTAKGQPFQKVDLEKTACEVIEDLEARIIETRGTVKQGYLPTIDADPFQMRQLFQNLIGNALKYHTVDTPPVVHLDSQLNQNGDWDISVQDNGIGLDEKFAEKIFVPLERLHGNSSYEGTGIGLAICKKITSRHGGRITVKSKPGEGSKFIVTLPKRQPAPS